MKKFYLLFVVSVLVKSLAAQCTPDPDLNGTGFTPAELPPAYTDAPYSQVLSFMAPRDTTTVINGNTVNVIIDSVILRDLVGVPENFSYQCLNACKINGGEKGCALLSGQADMSQLGLYRIKIVLETFYTVKNTTLHANRIDSADQYHFKIYAYTGLAHSAGTEKPSKVSAFPNPSRSSVQFDLSGLPHHSSGSLQIMDVLGRVVYSGSFTNNQAGIIDTRSFGNGLYKCVIRTGNDTYFSDFIRQ